MKITYNEISNPSKRGERFTRFSVKLDGKQVGTIKQTNQGWQYFPKGSRKAPGGATSPTLAACKASLEGLEPRYLGAEANEVLALAREEAREARISGVFDNPELMKLGPLSTLENDLARIDEGQDTIGEYSNAELQDAAGLEPSYANTYWSHKGKYEEFNAVLAKLIPREGEVPNAERNPALETFRVATNCYYDLYNNGLGNRGQEFAETFGFDAFDADDVELGGRDGFYIEKLSQELIDKTERMMNEFILAAYSEQVGDPYTSKPVSETIDITPVGCQTPEGVKRVTNSQQEFDDASAEVANLATRFLSNHGDDLQFAIGKLDRLSEIRGDFAELREAIGNRNAKIDAFLRAVAGAPER